MLSKPSARALAGLVIRPIHERHLPGPDLGLLGCAERVLRSLGYLTRGEPRAIATRRATSARRLPKGPSLQALHVLGK